VQGDGISSDQNVLYAVLVERLNDISDKHRESIYQYILVEENAGQYTYFPSDFCCHVRLRIQSN
jgi:hypothetical protein